MKSTYPPIRGSSIDSKLMDKNESDLKSHSTQSPLLNRLVLTLILLNSGNDSSLN